ncbi:MAG: ankyrin repeat domain-containing protein [Acidobacteria bacterium]|nr:MAG: ankyrin repeat domain-containing protein [Acidobacteriota bacterium]
MRVIRIAGVAALLCVGALTPIRGAVDAPVADAARRQDLDGVRALLAGGADVRAAHGDGMTGLHWAAHHGDTQMVRLLVDAGADLEATTRLGDHTPLHIASRGGHTRAVTALLDAGANTNAVTTPGATPLHFAATAGAADALRALLDHGADADAREPVWGQTPLMFAAAAARAKALAVLLERGANPHLSGRVVDIAARNDADRADSRRRRERMAATRDGREPEAAADQPKRDAPPATADTPSPEARATAAEAEAAAIEADLQEEPEPLGFADLVGTHGGLTALLLAARDGHTVAALTLIEGGADINQVSAADGTSPLLIATINGHFDLAMLFLERGADPTLASDAGATPLYGTLNMYWAPKARHPQPTDYMQQTVSYLELMEAVLEAGADVNARLTKSLWYTTYNRDLLGVDRTGATPFWRAAYALDIDAMRLLLDAGADPDLPTTKVPGRRRRGNDTDHSGLPPVALGGPAVSPLLAASGVGYGQGYAGNSHRHVPDGWLPAVRFLVEELGADIGFRDHNGYNALHHAAARGDNALIRYLVEQGTDVAQVSRRGQTTVDMANGPVQRIQPFPDTIALLERLGAKNNHRCLSC